MGNKSRIVLIILCGLIKSQPKRAGFLCFHYFISSITKYNPDFVVNSELYSAQCVESVPRY